MIDTNTSIRPAYGQNGTHSRVIPGQEALESFCREREELVASLVQGSRGTGVPSLWVVADDGRDLAPLVTGLKSYSAVNVVAKSLAVDLAPGLEQSVEAQVAVVSVSCDGDEGFGLIRRVKDQSPSLQVVAILPTVEPDFVFKALLAGASGYVGRGAEVEELVDALHQVHCGGSVLNSFTAGKVVQYFQSRSAPMHEANKPSVLSSREHQVLGFLSVGLAYKEIATELKISVETVRRHCHNLYEKLGVSSKSEAVARLGQLA
jgi:DNA-binding NarL/FixJ family response regulator